MGYLQAGIPEDMPGHPASLAQRAGDGLGHPG